MDEAKGRQVASRYGLQIMGTVGILLQAFKDGLLSYHEIIDCVFSLRRNHRRISENLLMDLMKEIERIESSR
jgi:predicted nucleic acid-binding protein